MLSSIYILNGIGVWRQSQKSASAGFPHCDRNQSQKDEYVWQIANTSVLRREAMAKQSEKQDRKFTYRRRDRILSF